MLCLKVFSRTKYFGCGMNNIFFILNVLIVKKKAKSPVGLIVHNILGHAAMSKTLWILGI